MDVTLAATISEFVGHDQRDDNADELRRAATVSLDADDVPEKYGTVTYADVSASESPISMSFPWPLQSFAYAG